MTGYYGSARFNFADTHLHSNYKLHLIKPCLPHTEDNRRENNKEMGINTLCQVVLVIHTENYQA